MEICDNCGKTIERTIDNLHGCGDIDDGYACSSEGADEFFNRKYPEED